MISRTGRGWYLKDWIAKAEGIENGAPGFSGVDAGARPKRSTRREGVLTGPFTITERYSKVG
jgi:hypothetical protein